MLKIVKTADGSNTIYNSEVGEHYHSKHGALQESRHVFVNSGLQYFLKKHETTAVSVLEVGFGTGLNFLLSAEHCIAQNLILDYVGIEPYPLGSDMMSDTGYDEYVAGNVWNDLLEIYPKALHQPVSLNKNCRLQISGCGLLNFQTERLFNVIYFDAFAAAYQPEMWNEAAIAHTVKFLEPGGVFVTYAITGNLKRTIKSLGLKVEKAPGAPGKREMLRATKPDDRN